MRSRCIDNFGLGIRKLTNVHHGILAVIFWEWGHENPKGLIGYGTVHKHYIFPLHAQLARK